jgi:hypothetical protein
VLGVIFPCAEIVTNVVAYGLAPNDLYWVLGTHAVAARAGAAVVAGLVVGGAAWRTTRSLSQPG